MLLCWSSPPGNPPGTTLEHVVLICSFVTLIIVLLLTDPDAAFLHVALGTMMIACAYGIPALKMPHLRAYSVVAAVSATLSCIAFVILSLVGFLLLFHLDGLKICAFENQNSAATGKFGAFEIVGVLLVLSLFLGGTLLSGVLVFKHVRIAKNRQKQNNVEIGETYATYQSAIPPAVTGMKSSVTPPQSLTPPLQSSKMPPPYDSNGNATGERY